MGWYSSSTGLQKTVLLPEGTLRALKRVKQGGTYLIEAESCCGPPFLCLPLLVCCFIFFEVSVIPVLGQVSMIV